MSQTTADAPGDRSKPRSSLLRFAKAAFFVGACLITLLAILIAEENWKGKRDWEKFKTEEEAKGEKFDWQSFMPPAVPDEENFAKTPFFRPLLDFDQATGQLRDTNAANATREYAAELFSTDRKDAGRRRRPNQKQSDYDTWLAGLQTNSSAAENLFATPAEAATEALKELEKYRPVLDELQAASQRPYCRFPFYQSKEYPAGLPLLPTELLKRFIQMYRLRARAELVLGRSEAAFTDAKVVIYLANTVQGEPDLLSGLIRVALVQAATRMMGEDLVKPGWNEAELAELQTELGKIDLLAEYGQVMRSERAYGNEGLADIRRRAGQVPVFPRGWIYQNQLFMDRMYPELYFLPVDAATHRVYPAKATTIEDVSAKGLKGGFSPYTMLAKLMMPALARAPQKFARAQVWLDEAVIACALERYRLAKGSYPETLDALMPQFIQKLPNDIFSGQPMKYHRTDDGQFMLYSVGWNEQDDGGKLVLNKNGKTVDIEQGDWVWPLRP